MKLGTGCLGLVVAAAIAVPTAVAIKTSMVEASARLDPNQKYQLTYEQDGDYYIADYNLTYEDCQKVLTVTKHDPDSYPKNTNGRYTCDRSPKLVSAK